MLLAILVFLALMMLVPLWRIATGASLARGRAVQIGAPRWIAWMAGVLTGAAVLVGAFLGGAAKSGVRSALAVLIAVTLRAYMMWRAGFRRGTGH